MTIGFLATGDEIIHGDTLNTNTYELAKTLFSEGLALGNHLICSDNEEDIRDGLLYLAKHHDILVTVGGLGPTSDDRTRYALAAFMGCSLITFSEALTHIEERLNQRQLAMTDGNKQQALFPEEATLLPNPFGTALGCYCHWNNKLLIMLPGPPRECLPMFITHVLPRLQHSLRQDKIQLKWRVFGVAEGAIADEIDRALRHLDCETGYRLETPYVECKVRCKPELIEQVKAIIEPIVTPHIICSPEKKASDLLKEKIQSLIQNYPNKTINIQDDVTGGMLQMLLQAPRNAAHLTFNSHQTSDYQFTLSGLKEYWQNLPPGVESCLSIDYQIKQDGESTYSNGHEERKIAYRSPLVVYIATEWLAFRLFHLIQ